MGGEGGSEREATGDGHGSQIVPAASRQNKPIVLVPSIVLFELLLPLPAKERVQFSRRFQSNFRVVPFDVASAAHAAQVWHTKKDEGVIERVKRDSAASRHALKADTQIIGTALAHGASCIYSHDTSLKKMAEGFIEVLEMEYERDLFSSPTNPPEEQPFRTRGQSEEEEP